MKSKNLILGLIIITIVGIVLWGIMLFLTWNKTSPNELLIDLGKTGASLSLISVVGGLVQWILKNRELEKQKEEEQLNFYKNVLSDFKSVYDKVERARLLIEAHRTAKTYGEQMRELIGGIVTLHNIKRALNPEFPTLAIELKPCINEMNTFIKTLLDEYRDNYKRISVLQSIDEAKKEILKKQKESASRPKISSDEIPSSAWKEIQKLKKLEVLRDDNHFKIYESEFLTYLDQASEILRKRIPVKEENKKNSAGNKA